MFASEAAKLLFKCDLQTKLPHKANLTIRCDNSQRVIAGAWLRPITTVQDLGTTWIARINVIGGLIRPSLPKVTS